MVGQRESTHQLDTLNNVGMVGTEVVFTTTGEFGRGPVNASCQLDFSKTNESSAREETIGQGLPRDCPDDQGGGCGQEV